MTLSFVKQLRIKLKTYALGKPELGLFPKELFCVLWTNRERAIIPRSRISLDACPILLLVRIILNSCFSYFNMSKAHSAKNFDRSSLSI